MAQSGRRVLLLDNDPQSSLTQGFFGPDAMRAVPPHRSVAALYEPGSCAAPESVIRPTGFARLSIVPGSRAVQRWNTPDESLWGASEGGLRSFLRDVGPDYDACLVDCPPNIHLCSWAALTASDGVVVPLQPEDFGAQGIFDITAATDAARSRVNGRLRLLGYLVTMVDRRIAVHTTYVGMLREMYPGDVFDAVVPRSKDFIEAVTARRPLTEYKPRSAAAAAVRAVADELLTRAGLTAGVVAA